LENINFLQTKDFFSLNALKCLRNEYVFNDCQLCFERCAYNALGIFKNKIKLFEELCTSCGACIGVCPTESLSLSTFDMSAFIFNFLEKDINQIIEKIDIPHFGMLDSHHLISLVLRSKRNLFLQFDGNSSSKDLDYIESQIKQSNLFLSSIGVEHSLFLKPHQSELQNNTRRHLFKTLVQAKNGLQQNSSVSQKLTQEQKTLPAKVTLFKNSLKLVCEDIVNTQISTQDLPLYNQKIDFQHCTNCVECITFCPTNALFQSATKESINFQSGKCIGCNICHQVCQHNAIQEEKNLDLIAFMFDKAELLVKFEYIKCDECNNMFIHKNQGTVCDVCKDYAYNHNNMFTLAKDL
jgi:ferredoxin